MGRKKTEVRKEEYMTARMKDGIKIRRKKKQVRKKEE